MLDFYSEDKKSECGSRPFYLGAATPLVTSSVLFVLHKDNFSARETVLGLFVLRPAFLERKKNTNQIMVTKTEAKAKKSSTGVPVEVRAQLAIDIEAAGGIQDFDKGKKQALDQLLNNPSRNIYGVRGSSLRLQIRNLVYTQWKKFTREKYLAKVVIPHIVCIDQNNKSSIRTRNLIC